MRTLWPLTLLALVACQDIDDVNDGVNDGEVITTVALTFTPAAGGGAVVAKWTDPEADGSPVIDPVTLSGGDDYALAVSFLNEMEDPAEDITEEVRDEGDQHQVFFTGTAVQGPATGENAAAVLTHAYVDTDANGLPVGLDSDVTARAAGAGVLTVTLFHLPPEGGVAVKVEGLAEQIAEAGFGALPGDADAQVSFDVTVE